MYHRLRERTRMDSGFTLIELLIVVLILGVLSGIVVFAVGNFNKDGQVEACKSDQKTVEIASEAYRAKVGTYASAIDDGTNTSLVGSGYLREAPNGGAVYTITYDKTTGKVTASGACTVN